LSLKVNAKWLGEISFVFLLLGSSNLLWSQTDTLYVGGRYDREDLKIRWSCADLDLLAIGFREGYSIQAETLSNGLVTSDRTIEVRAASEEVILSTCETEGDTLAFYIWQQIKSGTANLQSKEESDWQRAMMLFGIQDNYKLAEAMGMAYTIRNPETPLSYRITVSINHSRDAQLIRQQPVLDFPTINSLIEPLPPVCICKDNQLSITGDLLGVADLYSSYHIYRREDSTANYERRTSFPLLANYEGGSPLIFHLDSIGKEGYYQYAIQGKDMWGETGPFSPAENVLPCHILYAPPRLYGEEVEERGKVQLRWTLPDSILQYLEGFDVYRSKDKFDGYIKINDDLLPPTQFEYFDEDPLDVNFYYILADYHRDITSSSLSRMVAPIDTRPPGVPQNVQVEFDTSTFVARLTWNDVADDDLKGYRIHFSPNPDGDKFLLYNLEWEPNFFLDTLDKATLYTERTYWITSRDFNQNESYFSDSVTIKLADRFPPVPARITGVVSEYDHIQIIWERSPSEDAAEHILEFKSKNQTAWDSISLTADQYSNIYVDSNYIFGDTLQYRILVRDTAGLRSYSNQRLGYLLPAIFLPDLAIVSSEVSDSQLVIYFDYSEMYQVRDFHIMGGDTPDAMTTFWYVAPERYRVRQGMQKQNENGSFALYRFETPFDPKTPQYVKIRAIAEDGKISRFSPPHEISP